MSEPVVVKATVRDSYRDNCSGCYDIECRFEDGQKFVAIEVDGEFPELAHEIAEFLNARYRSSNK